VARQRLPRQRLGPEDVPCHHRCRAAMHVAAALFGRAVTIGAAKIVRFERKKSMLDLEIVLKNV